mgnify:CR=1 FL=1
MSSSLHSNASTHSKRYKLSPASSGRLKHELRWDPPVSDLLHHLRQTATSAFMFGGLLEDLARSPHDELRLWRLAAVYDQDEVVAAAAARETDGFCLLHGTDSDAVRTLAEQLRSRLAITRLSGEYEVIAEALESHELGCRVIRDHHEHFMTLRAFEHQIQPDGNYRFADEADIPRLKEYAAGYSAERNVPFRCDWRYMCRQGRVLVAEARADSAAAPVPDAEHNASKRRAGRRPIAACLLQGISFGPYTSCAGVYTFPEYRGQGYAQQLVANFCVLAAAAGYDTCLLVDATNAPAIAAYSRVGFRIKAAYRDVYLAGGSMRSIPM